MAENTTKVLIIATGGTMAMVNAGPHNSLVPSSVEDKLASLVELRHTDVPAYEILEWENAVDSSDLRMDDWVVLCNQISKAYDEYDGFVIIHGTDTLAYTASSLSFMLENLAKPVVLTGAMLPLDHIRGDARRNLVVSLLIAGYSNLAEVCVVFGSRILRGNRTRKMDGIHLEAFRSPNYPPLGRIGVDVTCDDRIQLAPAKRYLKVFTRLCENVVILKLTPLFPNSALSQILSATARPFGLILELYGAGTAPMNDPEFRKTLQKGLDEGVEIAAVTQCFAGECQLLLYENGAAMKDIGVIECWDMTPEAASAKMSYLMGKGYRGAQLRRLMETDIRGELTPRVTSAPKNLPISRNPYSNEMVVPPIVAMSEKPQPKLSLAVEVGTPNGSETNSTPDGERFNDV